MTKKLETIVFFGSGPVAAKSLELLQNNFNIEAVVTKPTKTRSNDPVPVLDLAKSLGIKTFLPSNKLELDELISTNPFKVNLAVLIDYGIIVSQNVIDYFSKGIINSHFSLLPKWRGADPITFSILSGEIKTGVSLMLITSGMDEGPLLLQAELEILKNDTSKELTDKLIQLSVRLLIEAIPDYLSGKLTPYPQPDDIKPTYSRKLIKQDGNIDWQKSAEQIEREIRAYIEWPKSFTKINDIPITITKAHTEPLNGSVGTYKIKDNQIIFYSSKNALIVDKLTPAGKNEMDSKSFLMGYRSRLG